MDIQRTVLIGALAIISYLLVLQWNQDYGNQRVPEQQVTSSSSFAQPPADQPQGGESAADVPVSPQMVTEGVTAPASASEALIEVSTDVLNALIDPRGGDIIQVALRKHKAQAQTDQPFILLEQNVSRTYVAQSGLTGRDGPDASGARPLYQAAQSSYQLAEGADQLQVALSFTNSKGVVITKTYTFARDSYAINLTYQVNNQSADGWRGNLFAQLKRDRSQDPTASTSMGMQSFVGPAFSTTENKYLKYDFDDIDDEPFKARSEGGWAGMLQHYFVSAWVPDQQTQQDFYARRSGDNYIAGFVSPALDVAPGSEGSVSATLYAGPKIQDRLEKLAPNLELTVDFGWLWWLAQPLFWLLKAIHSFVGNWGVAIILLTVLVKAGFFHLSAKAYKSMAKMRAVGPELQRLKELYGDDRQRMSQEMMKLYQKEKINPLGGCLPILIQMPVFIALYWVLLESVELRHAPFMLWINDLSAMDPYFVLPILMGASMFIQQQLNPTPPDPMQAKVMKMLPIIFTFFFLWFPAGLVVYWVVNNILSIAQQWVITRQIEGDVAARKK